MSKNGVNIDDYISNFHKKIKKLISIIKFNEFNYMYTFYSVLLDI